MQRTNLEFNRISGFENKYGCVTTSTDGLIVDLIMSLLHNPDRLIHIEPIHLEPKHELIGYGLFFKNPGEKPAYRAELDDWNFASIKEALARFNISDNRTEADPDKPTRLPANLLALVRLRQQKNRADN